MSYKPPLSRAERIPRADAGYRVTNGNIAAIDFGTTSVSVAYTLNSKDIITLKFGTENHSTRVSNAVLLKRDGRNMSVEALGSSARDLCASMKPEELRDYVYFERVKMLLKREKDVNREVKVESISGGKFYLVEVIAFILQYLKDQVIAKSQGGIQIKATDFDWVITVPAIWDARGKRMMREAAYLAGLLTDVRITCFTPTSETPILPPEVNADKLSLALEPESAALYSQENILEKIASNATLAVIRHPTEYMVIDIGGGTVDITAHSEVDGSIVVENVPTGNAWGGTQVNEAFSKMLQNIVNDPGFERYIDAGDQLQRKVVLNRLIYTEFENQKILYGKCQAKFITINNLPNSFCKFFAKELEKANQIVGVEYNEEDNKLYIEKKVAESQLFGPALDGIIECTLEAIKENKYKVNTFYLVGGFGGCKYVCEKVTKAIEEAYSSIKKACNVIIPVSHELAVAQGAVIWRRNPEKIKARRSDATYGIGVYATFDPEIHDIRYRFYHDEERKYKCDHIFKVFMERGEMAKSDEVVTTCLTPRNKVQKQVNATIYSTSDLGVQYTEDENGKSTVKAIGKVVIDIPNPDNLPKDQLKVDVTMDFSGTEIHAKAKYRRNEEEVKTVCDFLSAQKDI